MNRMTQTNIFIEKHYPANKRSGLVIIFFTFCISLATSLNASQDIPCLKNIAPSDAILISAHNGRILYTKNEAKKCIPASTLKILTALTAIHHLGLSHKFRTEFYTNADQDLIIKGFGDPLLTSEVWLEISEVLVDKIQQFNNLILDISYFSQQIKIPGVENSTNPYDAPLGALCANFNTVFFDHDNQGKLISVEPQTPMIPFARKKIDTLGQKNGRYTLSQDPRDAAYYAGELFLHFLKKKGAKSNGKIRMGTVGLEDRLIHVYHSSHTLEMLLKKMMTFSNNFLANQICIAMGAYAYGPPGTLEKGVRVISNYAKEELHLENMEIVEGSGISRKNQISALEMRAILVSFKTYRHLLNKSGKIFFKTGTLKGINTRAGYIERLPDNPYNFVVFLNTGTSNIESLMNCIKRVFTN